MWELTKSFRFEAAHSLRGTTLGETSEEIHGHSYRAEVTIKGVPEADTGMLMDMGVFEQRLSDIQKKLDHKLLDRIQALGPATLENLSRFIWDNVQHTGRVVRVTVHRDSCGESCTYFGPSSGS